jgi:hypothetical protein
LHEDCNSCKETIASSDEYNETLVPIAFALYRKFNPFQGRAFLHGRARNKLNKARATLFHGISLRISFSPIETARYKQIHSVPTENSWIH